MMHPEKMLIESWAEQYAVELFDLSCRGGWQDDCWLLTYAVLTMLHLLEEPRPSRRQSRFAHDKALRSIVKAGG